MSSSSRYQLPPAPTLELISLLLFLTSVLSHVLAGTILATSSHMLWSSSPFYSSSPLSYPSRYRYLLPRAPVLDLITLMLALISVLSQQVLDSYYQYPSPSLLLRSSSAVYSSSSLSYLSQCCGSDFFPSRIPDPNCLHPGSSSKNLSILTLKKAKKMV
jgi:hypothetical protein